MSAAAVSDPRPPDVGNATSEPATGATIEATANAQAATAPIADAKLRRQRFAREMEREIASLHFDGARFVAQLRGATAAERAAAAQRLLLPVEPQRSVDPAVDAPALVRSLVLDPAYQLK